MWMFTIKISIVYLSAKVITVRAIWWITVIMAERLGINIEITDPPDRPTNHQHFHSQSLANVSQINQWLAVKFDALC